MRPIRIAVVDDDQVYQFIINRTVSKLTCDSKILSFSNCADFFNFIKRNIAQPQLLPDLVLLDLNTPFMNGWEFLNAFRNLKYSIEKEMHIYMVTSSVDPSDERRAGGFSELSGFFQKPISPEQLYEIAVKASVL